MADNWWDSLLQALKSKAELAAAAMLTGSVALFQWFLSIFFERSGSREALGIPLDRLLVLFVAMYASVPLLLLSYLFVARDERLPWSKLLAALGLTSLVALLSESFWGIGPQIVLASGLLIGAAQLICQGALPTIRSATGSSNVSLRLIDVLILVLVAVGMSALVLWGDVSAHLGLFVAAVLGIGASLAFVRPSLVPRTLVRNAELREDALKKVNAAAPSAEALMASGDIRRVAFRLAMLGVAIFGFVLVQHAGDAERVKHLFRGCEGLPRSAMADWEHLADSSQNLCWYARLRDSLTESGILDSLEMATASSARVNRVLAIVDAMRNREEGAAEADRERVRSLLAQRTSYRPAPRPTLTFAAGPDLALVGRARDACAIKGAMIDRLVLDTLRLQLPSANDSTTLRKAKVDSVNTLKAVTSICSTIVVREKELMAYAHMAGSRGLANFATWLREEWASQLNAYRAALLLSYVLAGMLVLLSILVTKSESAGDASAPNVPPPTDVLKEHQAAWLPSLLLVATLIGPLLPAFRPEYAPIDAPASIFRFPQWTVVAASATPNPARPRVPGDSLGEMGSPLEPTRKDTTGAESDSAAFARIFDALGILHADVHGLSTSAETLSTAVKNQPPGRDFWK